MNDNDDGSDEANEEVVRILKQASEEVIDSVDLSSQQLRFLPEAFGKLTSLIHLNLSNNHLQVSFSVLPLILYVQFRLISTNLLSSGRIMILMLLYLLNYIKPCSYLQPVC